MVFLLIWIGLSIPMAFVVGRMLHDPLAATPAATGGDSGALLPVQHPAGATVLATESACADPAASNPRV